MRPGEISAGKGTNGVHRDAASSLILAVLFAGIKKTNGNAKQKQKNKEVQYLLFFR